jgi:hypothetical protein
MTRHNHVVYLLYIYFYTNLPSSFLQSFCYIFYGICVLTQYMKAISADQELMCSIQFQIFQIVLDLPDSIK